MIKKLLGMVLAAVVLMLPSAAKAEVQYSDGFGSTSINTNVWVDPANAWGNGSFYQDGSKLNFVASGEGGCPVYFKFFF